MDPSTTLALIRIDVAAFHKAIIEGDRQEADRAAMAIADNFLALDEWLVRSGALPQAWRVRCHH
jgi:hypothetical protein